MVTPEGHVDPAFTVAHRELYQYWSHEFGGDTARDEAGATRALRQHIERTTAALIDYAERASA
ncbi:hypothetical protein ABZ847_09625 [Streptomyces bauhiniae]